MQNNLFLSNRFIKSFHLTFSIVPQLKKKTLIISNAILVNNSDQSDQSSRFLFGF